MKRFAVSILAASLAAVVLPQAVAAQCEGGVTVAGFYTRDGSYMPGHCAFTNPTTPGQLYPSGAQPVPSTNPALGASRLPGQQTPSGLLPVTSSDLGPAPSFVNVTPLQGGGAAAMGPSVGPGTPLAAEITAAATLNPTGTVATTQQAAAAVNTTALSTTGTAATTSALPGQPVTSSATIMTGRPDQSPQTGLPALNANRAVPSSLTTGEAASMPGLFTAPGAVAGTVGAAGTAGVAAGAVGATGTVGAVGVPGTAGALAVPNNATARTGAAVTGATNVTAETNVNQVNTSYGVSLGAAPPREQTYTGQQLNSVTITYPNQ